MNLSELPQMASSTYSSAALHPTALLAAVTPDARGWNSLQNTFNTLLPPGDPRHFLSPEHHQLKENILMANTQRRLVQIFIADPDPNVPLDNCLLYSGKQLLTDLTDQELFFEVDVKTILDAHNKTRVSLINKAVKDRAEYLEPARVRDLKMTVVTIAQF